MRVHGSKHPREQVGVAMGNELPVCVNILVQRDGWRGGGANQLGTPGTTKNDSHRAGTLRGGWRTLKKSL